MRTLFGIGLAIFAVALVITTWSVEPTVGKTPTVSVDPLGLMTTTTNLPQRITKILAPSTDRSRLRRATCPGRVLLPTTRASFLPL